MAADEGKPWKTSPHNNLLNLVFLYLELPRLRNSMFVSPSREHVMANGSLFVSAQLSRLQVLLWHYLSAKRTFANSPGQFGLTSYFTGLICYILTLARFNTKPDKKQQDPLNPCVSAAANNSCNFNGLILQPCHECGHGQERIILLQAA